MKEERRDQLDQSFACAQLGCLKHCSFHWIHIKDPPQKLTAGTWKWWFPIGISFSKGPFSGSMFVLGGVSPDLGCFSIKMVIMLLLVVLKILNTKRSVFFLISFDPGVCCLYPWLIVLLLGLG